MNTTDRKTTLETVKGILREYPVISLNEMEESHLMSRFDEKYLFHLSELTSFLEELKPFYRVLSVNDYLLAQYENIYFDTPDLKSYHDHHNGKATRYKIRFRRYADSGLCYFEIKRKDNRGYTNKERHRADEMRRDLTRQQLDFVAATARDYPLTLSPSLSNSFYRVTLVNSIYRERVTLDLMIHFKNETHEKGLEQVVIAEVKQEHHYYDSAFKRLMQRERIFPVGFSKYCMGTLLTHPGIKYNRFKPKLTSLNRICDGPA